MIYKSPDVFSVFTVMRSCQTSRVWLLAFGFSRVASRVLQGACRQKQQGTVTLI
jgi:hypothetical protein